MPAYAGSTTGLNRNAYIHTGQKSKVGDQMISGQKRLKLHPDVETEFTAVDEGIEVLILQGRDIGEPVVQHGPFVGNSREDISKAFKDYQAEDSSWDSCWLAQLKFYEIDWNCRIELFWTLLYIWGMGTFGDLPELLFWQSSSFHVLKIDPVAHV